MPDPTLEESIADMNERDRVLGIVSKWTPEQLQVASQNSSDPKVANALRVYDDFARGVAIRSAQRPEKLEVPAKGLLGFKAMLPTWMGGSTIKYEEPMPDKGESLPDYHLRAEMTYAKAFDQAKATGTPIVRMREDRKEAPDALWQDVRDPQNYVNGQYVNRDQRRLMGVVDNVTSAVPGLRAFRDFSLQNQHAIDSPMTPIPGGAETGAMMKRAGAEAPMSEKLGIPLAASLAMPGVGPLAEGTLLGKVVNNPLVRGTTAGGVGAGIEGASQGEDAGQVMQDMKYGAGMGLGFGILGGLGGKAASMINEGPMKKDLFNLRAAGGDTSFFGGVKLPKTVEESLAAAGGAQPASHALKLATDKFSAPIAQQKELEVAKFISDNNSYLTSDIGQRPIVPRAFTGAIMDAALGLRGVVGAKPAREAVRSLASEAYRPISLANGTLIHPHEAAAAQRAGWSVKTLDEAEAIGIPIEEPFIERQPHEDAGPAGVTPGEGPATGRQSPDAMAAGEPTPPMQTPLEGPTTERQTGPIKLDRSAFRAVLQPLPMTASQISKTEDAIYAISKNDSLVAKEMKPILAGLLKSRDDLPPHPLYAPSSLKATIDTVNGPVEVNGYSALNALASQAKKSMDTRLRSMGIKSNAMDQEGMTALEGLTPEMEKAIKRFHRGENPRLDAALQAEAAKIPGGKEALYAVPAARAAERLQQKSSIIGNPPMMGTSFMNFKPFFRAVGMHAEPITSKMAGRVPAAALATGAEGSDMAKLMELAKQLEQEKSQQFSNWVNGLGR